MDIDFGAIAIIVVAIIMATMANEYIIKRQAAEKEAREAEQAAAKVTLNSNGPSEDTVESYIKKHYPAALS